MAKEILTSIIYKEDELIWETFLPLKAGFKTVASGVVTRDISSDDKGEQSDDGQDDAAVWADQVKAECSVIKGDVALSFYSENVLLRVVDLPPVPDEELSDVVYLQVDKFSPFPVDSMVVSHEVLSRSEQSCKVLIGAIRQKVADAAGEVLNAIGIFPARVDVSALLRWRLLKDAGEIIKKGRHIILILEKDVPELMIIQDGLPLLFRSFAAERSLEGEEFEDELIGEINYTLMSLSLEHGDGDLETQAAIWYHSSAPQRLADKLHEECSCDVKMHSLDSLPSLSEGAIRRSADTDCVKIDLTPESWKTADQSRMFKKKMITAGSVLLGIWLLGVVGFFGTLAFKEHQLKTLKSEKDKWHGPAMEVRELRERAQTIGGYFDHSRSALECLRESSALQPQGIELASFIYRKSAETKNETVELDGQADQRQQILMFQDNLTKSELFEKVESGSVKQNRSGKLQFSFDIQLPPRGEKE